MGKKVMILLVGTVISVLIVTHITNNDNERLKECITKSKNERLKES